MLSIYKKFFNFCGEKNKKKFKISIFFGVLKAFFEALRVPATYVMIKAVLENNVTLNTCLTSLGIILVSIVGVTLLRSKSMMLQTEAGYETAANKRIEIAEHLKYLPMGYFNENSLGYITSVTTNTMEVLGDTATKVIMMTTEGLLTTILIMCLVFTFDIRIGLVILIGLIVFMLVNTKLRANSSFVSEEKDIADRNMVSNILEYVQGMAEVKSYSLFSKQNKKLDDSIKQASKVNVDMELKLLPAMGLQSLVTKLTGVCVIGFSIFFYLDGSMDLPSCITMLICAFMMYSSLDSAGSFTAILRCIDIGVNKANEILNIKSMDIDGKDTVAPTYDISFENVDFSYEKRKIINDLSFDIKQGTTTAIVGPSGGGKTTICRLMARFWDVDKGVIKLGGIDVKDYSIDSLMKNFSFVFQNVYLFEDTIANNIRFGKPEASDEEVIEIAKKACCHEFIQKLPNGYNTIIGEGGSTLSGGEKQRISIARAMMKDAPIIILDEATANVDPENEKELMSAIEELTRKKTIIMIAHRLKTVRNADKILVIDKGEIVQNGTHDELMKQDNIYRKFINARELAVGWKI
ncbi:ATP-binding cassette, subfamily B [[Eubacterium] yurii]|jgi:ABC superfamily ATP binding cassette transporter, ABC/membrane protein|nr:ATP-binding cassette, subfamily B [[Eubacterium] yurii]